MVVTEAISMAEPDSSPRLSFSADFLNESDFISISPSGNSGGDKVDLRTVGDFEFLSNKILNGSNSTMLTADELFFEGKFLPYWQIQHAAERLASVNLSNNNNEDVDKNNANDENSNNSNKNDTDESGEKKKKTGIVLDQQGSMNKMEPPRIWYIDDDPSPRPPNCTVLWKELLRLRKRRQPSNNSSALTPSLSSSSSSSSSSSMGDQAAAMAEDQGKEEVISMKEKHLRRIKKGLERTKSATMRMRPMVNVPVCTQTKGGSMPPLFPLKKGR